MAFILSLVYKCAQQKVDLVSEKYYEQELSYQQHVNKLNNTADLNEKMQIRYRNDAFMVEIFYPANTDFNKISGNINFFKPDIAALDFNLHVKCNDQYSQLIPVSTLKKGWWNIRVNWESSGTPYYSEQKIFIE